MRRAKVLVVDDEEPFRPVLCEVLTKHGLTVRDAATAEDGKGLLEQEAFDLVVSDLRLPGMSGLDLLREVREKAPDLSFMMITAYGDIDSAVEAIKLGASDYLTKPFLFDDIILRIDRLLDHAALERSHAELQNELVERYEPRGMVGRSPAMHQVRDLIGRVAPTNSNVLILGESGTGKEVVARAIHRVSHRHDRALTSVNCAALSETLLESELFGYAKGAFTGATQSKEGLFQVADGATLFLDEIGAMPVAVQNKLLRAVEIKEIVPVGATVAVKVDVRILAATSVNLVEAVLKGEFLDALYYRLNVVEIHIPPLRTRKEDIPVLVDHFIRRLNQELKKNVQGVDDDAMAVLLAYQWPGNVRELENAIERSMILSDGDQISAPSLPLSMQQAVPSLRADAPFDLRHALQKREREHIFAVLEVAKQDKVRAAEMLGISLSSLYRKLETSASQTDSRNRESGVTSPQEASEATVSRPRNGLIC